MIIFGWNFQTIKQIGFVFKKVCEHCNNEEYWVLTRTITWFTLFFIPVIPYSFKFFLSCPVCRYGFDLNREQVNSIRPLAEVNQLLVDGKITKDEYQTRVDTLNRAELDSSNQNEITTNEVILDNNTDLIYCGNCGSKITKELKFCGNCGVKVV